MKILKYPELFFFLNLYWSAHNIVLISVATQAVKYTWKKKSSLWKYIGKVKSKFENYQKYY